MTTLKDFFRRLKCKKHSMGWKTVYFEGEGMNIKMNLQGEYRFWYSETDRF